MAAPEIVLRRSGRLDTILFDARPVGHDPAPVRPVSMHSMRKHPRISRTARPRTREPLPSLIPSVASLKREWANGNAEGNSTVGAMSSMALAGCISPMPRLPLLSRVCGRFAAGR
jgi:hypothetical protein